MNEYDRQCLPELERKKETVLSSPENCLSCRLCLVHKKKIFGIHIGCIGRMSGDVFGY
jgi:hypothetical protein